MKVNIQNIIKKISKKGNSASLLITHRNVEEQLTTVEDIVRKILNLKKGAAYKACPDVFGIWPENIEGKTIKIEQIHQFIKTTQLKPYANKFKVGVIISLEKATKEAQNALLKTIEEPPKNTFLVLTATSSTKLLPTINSRCQIIELEDREQRKYDQRTIKKLLNANIVKRFEMIEEIIKQKDKSIVDEEVCLLLDTLLLYFRKRLLKSHKDKEKTKNIFEIIKLIEVTKLAIDSNVNLRLALENLMINLPLKGEDF